MKIQHLLMLLTLLLLFSCGGLGSTGSSTETIGFVYNEQGKPIPGALITFIRNDFNPQINGEFDTLYSDDDGEYSFRNINDGVYNLQISKEGERAFHREIKVSNGSVDSIVQDTIRPVGRIEGVIRHQNSMDNSGIYVLFIGTDRYAVTKDVEGNFDADNLAKGEYTLKIITELEDYETATKVISVTSGGTTVLDTIELAYTGIPTPEGLQLTFDTLLQEAHLRWNAVVSDSLARYDIERVDGWGNKVLMQQTCDTNFIDQVVLDPGVMDGKFTYRVHAVHQNGKSGKYSQRISVNVGSSFSVNSLDIHGVPIEGKYKNLICDNDGVLYATGSKESEIFRFDLPQNKSLESIKLPELGDKPLDLHIMNNGNILYTANQNLFILDGHGELADTYKSDYTRSVSSAYSRYIYYSTSFDGSDWEQDAILRWDLVAGCTDTILFDSNRSVMDFYISENNIYVLFKEYESLTLERSSLFNYEPDVLFSTIDNGSPLRIEGSGECVSLLSNSWVTIFNEGKRTLCTPVGKSVVDVSHLRNQCFVAIDRDGRCMRFDKINSENIEGGE